MRSQHPMFVRIAAFLFGCAAAFTASAQVVDGVELPPIPTKASAAPTSAPAPQGGGASLVDKYRFNNDAAPSDEARRPQELRVRPGHNELVTVAKGHVNRIVTPFDKPVIRTSSSVELYQEGPDIYLTTPPDEATVSMFILDAAGGPAISLSLLPRSVPPREIRLTLEKDNSYFNALRQTATGLPVETDAPYVTAMLGVLTEIAKGQIPTGYRLTDPTPDDHILFYCPIPASRTELLQVVEGSKWRVGVSRVRNQSHQAIEVRESDCQAEGRLSSALYPNAVIPAGAEAELYIVIQRDKRTTATQRKRDYVITR